MKGEYMVVSKKNIGAGLTKVPYKSELAERMSEDDVLRLIESIFRGGVK